VNLVCCKDSFTHFMILPAFLVIMCGLADQYDPDICLGHLKGYTFKELRVEVVKPKLTLV
jgi:hypothetical protein